MLVTAAVIGVVAVILIGSGFVSALPAMMAGNSQLSSLEVTQPPAVPFDVGTAGDGYDVSFPQCGTALPDIAGKFAIVGVTGGRPFKDQPCFPDQAWWMQQGAAYAVYVNTEFDGVGDPADTGRAIADDAHQRIDNQYLPAATPVWLDVETDNVWRGTREQNGAVLQAAATRLTELGHPVGVYSTPKLWRSVTGGIDPGMPTWLGLGPGDRAMAEAACSRTGFGGQRPAIVQWIQELPDGRKLDHNLLCRDAPGSGILMPVG